MLEFIVIVGLVLFLIALGLPWWAALIGVWIINQL